MKLKAQPSPKKSAQEMAWRRLAVQASELLGQGCLQHPKNDRLRQNLQLGNLTAAGFYRELLRIVYRCWFLILANRRQPIPSIVSAVDQWEMFPLICGDLGLDESPLSDMSLANDIFVTAVQMLDCGDLDWLKLGSVYETLLEFEPRIDLNDREFSLRKAARHERKITGSYYTPDSLIQSLLDAAFEPVIAEAIVDQSAEQATASLLDLKICDPACGSGYFLIAAARRLARHVARLDRMDERTALRKIIVNCLYGVDLNPLAVELCKIGLWLEVGAPQISLTLFQRHIRCGNSLLGATSELVGCGIPDEAFRPIVEEDKAVATALKRQNREEGGGRGFCQSDADIKVSSPATSIPDSLVYDAWCTAFVWKKDKSDLGRQCPTQCALQTMERKPDDIPQQVKEEIARLAWKHKFFHWHLAFPQVFDQRGGFDLVLGNPPYVAGYSRHSARKDVELVRTASLMLHALGSREDQRRVSGRANLFLGFVWRSLHLLRRGGRAGLIVPDALLTNESYVATRQSLLSEEAIRQVCLFRTAIFPDATVGTAFVVLGQSATPNLEVAITTVDNQPQSAEGARSVYLIAPSQLLERPKASWHPDMVVPVRTHCEMVRLGDIAEVRDGINPGPSVVRKRLIGTVAQGDNPRRLIEGSNIQPFHLTWTGLWIDYRATQISREERKRGASLRESWIFESPKIVYRQTAQYPIAAVDTAGYYGLNSVHHVVLRESQEELLWALCAYLNSTTCRALYQAHTGETRRVFPQVHVSSIKMLPVPRQLLDVSNSLTARLSSLARQVSALAGRDQAHERAKLLHEIDVSIVRFVTGSS